MTACLAAVAIVHGALFATPKQRSAAAVENIPLFRDVAAAAGLDFVHINGASPQRLLPEILGPGGLFLDFDSDGWLDVFLVDGGSLSDGPAAHGARHRLYRNRGDGTFVDVTATAGIRHRGYGMGACAGDMDNDGAVDLYITGVGVNQLYRNAGRGRFTEVPNAGGAAPNRWSTSCAFADIDRDGDLDLFVANYVDARLADNPFCGIAGPPPVRDYCHPLMYPPSPAALYRNTGRGSFEDISTSSGIAAQPGNGLGVAVSDVDDDGWPDVFVANDATPNVLFRNDRDGTFTDIGGVAGVAVTADAKAKAGMGVGFGDFAGTGRLGLIVTNHEAEMHSLFLDAGGGIFTDVTLRSGVGPVTRPYVGFGVAFVDYDNDSDLDVAIANGHVMANVSRLRGGGELAQRNLLLRNDGAGRFQNVTAQAGPGLSLVMVSRALAAGDVDNDGDLDLLIANNGGPVNLLMNEGATPGAAPANRAANAMLVRLIGSGSNRSAIGARLTLVSGGRRQVREVQSGSSYLTQHDLRAHFGLGAASQSERLEIRWPGGAIEIVAQPPANHIVTVREGEGIIARTPFRR